VKINENHWWTLFFVALGYFGAAVFYSYLVGINVQTQIACPVCPQIDSLGTPLHKFVSRVMTLGTLNALLFVLMGWTFISLARFTKRIASG
jgi:hypothetical protein